jgi:hypothetical protein
MSISATNIRLLLVRSDPRFQEGVNRGLQEVEIGQHASIAEFRAACEARLAALRNSRGT